MQRLLILLYCLLGFYFSSPSWGEWSKSILHLHTSYSDGKQKPREVLAQIKQRHYDIGAIVFTDHDRTFFEKQSGGSANQKYEELARFCESSDSPKAYAGCELTLQFRANGYKFESHALLPFLTKKLVSILCDYNGWTNDPKEQWGEGRFWADSFTLRSYCEDILSEAYRSGVPVILAHPFHLDNFSMGRELLGASLEIARESSKKLPKPKSESSSAKESLFQLVKKAVTLPAKMVRDLAQWTISLGKAELTLPRREVIYKYVAPSYDLLQKALPKGSLIYIDLFNKDSFDVEEEFKLAKSLEEAGFRVAFVTSADWHGITASQLGATTTSDIVEDIFLSLNTAYPDQLNHFTFFSPDFKDGYLKGSSLAAVGDYWFTEIDPLPSTKVYGDLSKINITLNKKIEDDVSLLVVQDFNLDRPVLNQKLEAGKKSFTIKISELLSFDSNEHSLSLILAERHRLLGSHVPICVTSPIRYRSGKKAWIYIALALDDSLSMDFKDPATGLSKLIRSRKGVDEMLAIAPGDEVAMSLSLYRAEAEVVSLLKPIREISRSDYWIRIRVEDGTAIGKGILAALSTLPPEGRRAIILLTDGQNNRPGLQEAIQTAQREKVPIFTIAYGTSKDRPDLFTLTEIAEATGGFMSSADVESVGQVFQRILSLLSSESTLLSIQDRVTRQGNTYELPLASGFQSLTATIAPTRDAEITGYLESPEKNRHPFSGSPARASVSNPTEGIWRIRVEANPPVVSMISVSGKGEFSANWVSLPARVPVGSIVDIYLAVRSDRPPSRIDLTVTKPQKSSLFSRTSSKVTEQMEYYEERGEYKVYKSVVRADAPGPYYLVADIECEGQTQRLSASFYAGGESLESQELMLLKAFLLIIRELMRK